MKRLWFGMALALAAATAVGAQQADLKDPVGKFEDYNGAMASVDADPMAVEWQNANDAAIKAATSDAACAAVVKSAASAAMLLAQVKGAYRTDPLVATKAAAVTQWTMGCDGVSWFNFWSDTPKADGRKVWVQALLATAEANDDPYVKQFCLEQLRWCGCTCSRVLDRIRAIGEKSDNEGVKDLADLAVRGIEGK